MLYYLINFNELKCSFKLHSFGSDVIWKVTSNQSYRINVMSKKKVQYLSPKCSGSMNLQKM